MTAAATPAPGQSPVYATKDIRTPAWRWSHSIWMLWLLPLGFTSFISFLYIGLKTRKRAWIIAGLIYALPHVGGIATSGDSAAQNVFVVAVLVVWPIAFIHAIVARPHYLGEIAGLRFAPTAAIKEHRAAEKAKASARQSRAAEKTKETRAADDALANATAALRGAIKSYNASITLGQQSKAKAEKQHGKTVKAATKALQEAAKQLKVDGGVFSPVTLYDESVSIGSKRYPLSEETRAVVDTAGNLMTTRRYTLTRFALIGAFSVFTPKKTHDDKRELYLLVEDPEWAQVVKYNPDKGTAARRMAQNIGLSARKVAAARQARLQRTAKAQVHLDAVKSDRSAVQAEEQRIAEARANIGPVRETRGQVSALVQAAKQDSRVVRRAEEALDEADALLELGRNPEDEHPNSDPESNDTDPPDSEGVSGVPSAPKDNGPPGTPGASDVAEEQPGHDAHDDAGTP